jgi:hypothetical protein
MSVVASPGSPADVDLRADVDSLVGVDVDVEAARLRHPSAGRWQPDHVRLARRFAEVLANSGARCPDVAAAALALRSRSGLDRTDFARALGVNDRDLLAVEAGACPVDRLPPPLADAAFFLRVLSTLRSLRLAGCGGSNPGQPGPAATATGRPPVSFSRSP